MKRATTWILVLAMALMLLAGCQQTPEESKAPSESTVTENDNWKIAVMTSTVTQGEEAYRAGEMVAEQYKGHVTHVTYPDNFTTEQEVALSTLLSLAADPDVKAILVSGAPAGFSAMFDKVKEKRPDMLIWAGSPSDDISVAAAAADICFDIDIVQQGYQLAQAAKDMGCETVVHYSFPRHMAVEKLLARRNAMEERCKELNITFVDATTPDPTSDSGTNQAQVEPMIKTVLENGGYFLMPNDPSPFIGFASALGIEVPDEYQGDTAYMEKAISDKLAAQNLTGHAGNWNVSLQMLNLQVGAYYAQMYIKGETQGLFDADAFNKAMVAVAGEGVSIRANSDASGNELSNYMLILADYMTY